jgi:hypothetical protein
MLTGVVLALFMGITCLQQLQSRVFGVVPFGVGASVSIGSTCTSVLLSGMFMLYFGACVANTSNRYVSCLPLPASAL